MEIGQDPRGAVLVMAPVGRLDTDSAADLELAIQDAIAAGWSHFVVDLAQINYVSSAGLRVLLMLAKSVDGKGSLRVAGLNAQVQQVFDIAGFTKLFAIHPDRDAALRAHPGVSLPSPVAAAPAKPARAERSEAPKAEAPRVEAPKAEAPKPAAASAEPRREEAPRPAAPPETRKPAPQPAAAARATEPAKVEAPPRPVEAAAPAPPAPAPEPPYAVLARHAARLLGAAESPRASRDPSSNTLARHAALLLGIPLDGAAAAPRAAGAPRKSAPPPTPQGAITAPPPSRTSALGETAEEKGGFFSRLFGKKKRTPGI